VCSLEVISSRQQGRFCSTVSAIDSTHWRKTRCRPGKDHVDQSHSSLRAFEHFTADRRRGVVILRNTAADADAPLEPKAIVLPVRSLGD
jgi:hypothetical protein